MRLCLGLFLALVAGCGGGSPENDAGVGSAGQDGQAADAAGAGGEDGAACPVGSDYASTSCFNGLVTYTVFCPASSQSVGRCPYGCRASGAFGDAGLSLCNASPDGGCDGACTDASDGPDDPTLDDASLDAPAVAEH